MIDVSNAGRIVFPEVGRTKGDVVAYYQRIALRALPHAAGRPLSIRRYPKGVAAPGFFQKNVPEHYPASIARLAIPRSPAAARRHRRKGAPGSEVTVYPVISLPEHLAYLANQGAIELHVPSVHADDLHRPDRIVLDLDPPSGAVALVRRAARVARDALAELGLDTVPVATGSKGYHVVAVIRRSLGVEALALAVQKVATMLVAREPDLLTLAFRIANRGARVFDDWLRNLTLATAIVPYSLRARPRATVAAPLRWDELEATPPDAFTMDDVERLLDRPDSLAELAASPGDGEGFARAADAAFARSGLVLETFDRFRS